MLTLQVKKTRLFLLMKNSLLARVFNASAIRYMMSGQSTQILIEFINLNYLKIILILFLYFKYIYFN